MTNSRQPPTCPSPSCAPCRSSANSGPSPLAPVRHSILRTATGDRQRWRCKGCRRTFTARSGTAYHRLRKPASRFDEAIQMSVEGVTKAAIARVSRVSAGTVTRWIERAAKYVRKFQDRTICDVEPVELQIDELRGWGPSRDDRHFVFSALDVTSRLWLSQRVGGRTRRNCRLLLRDTRNKSAFGRQRVLIVTDAFRFYRDAVVRAWGFSCVDVEASKLYRGGRVVWSSHTLVHGTQWQLDDIRERSEDSKTINTSYAERLNLFKRRSTVGLHRRSNSLPRSRESLSWSIDLLQCYYNFVRPHGSLKFGKEVRTPAQQAGLVTRRLSLRDIFLAFQPWARVSWLKNSKVRAKWRLACASNS